MNKIRVFAIKVKYLTSQKSGSKQLAHTHTHTHFVTSIIDPPSGGSMRVA